LAISYYEKALAIDSNYANAYNNLAIAYKKQGDIDRYVKTLRESTKVSRRRGFRLWGRD
jgi:tetratricopeptide (TPR) repeat protein